MKYVAYYFHLAYEFCGTTISNFRLDYWRRSEEIDLPKMSMTWTVSSITMNVMSLLAFSVASDGIVNGYHVKHFLGLLSILRLSDHGGELIE
jgi:hypothetical protein